MTDPRPGRLPTDRLHLLARHREKLEDLLRVHLPGVEVWAYGSRVNGRSHDGSDLDLVLHGPDLQEIPPGQLADFTEALRDSTIPFLVEARDWAHLPERFHREIEAEHVVLVEEEERGVAGKWAYLPFSEAVQINPPVPLKCGKTYPFVDMASVNVDSRHVSPSQSRKFRSGGSRFQSGDTLMARITPCLENGKIARYWAPDGPPSSHGSTEFIVVRGRPNITDRNFSYYLTQWDEVRNYAIGQMTGTSGRQRVPIDSLDHLIVPVPPLLEQRAIAHILGTLDDKIELNRRMNETLEGMARALFTSWFVDFDPVRAKMDGRDPGLPKHIADLFPDRLVDSEAGEIPEGWAVKALRDCAALNPESWSPAHTPEAVDYVDLANTKWGVIEGTQHFLWKDAPSRAKRILRTGDTIVGTVRPGNGSYALVGNDGLTGSTGFAVLRPTHSKYRELVYLAATTAANLERLAYRADGAAYPAVRPHVVGETPVVIPQGDNGVLTCFSTTVVPMLARIEWNKTESRALASLRDTLLPRLISGELRVPDAGF